MKATKCRKGERNFHQVWRNGIAARGVGGETLCYFLPKQDTALVVIVKERDSIIHSLRRLLLFTQESAGSWGCSAPSGTAGRFEFTTSEGLRSEACCACKLAPWKFSAWQPVAPWFEQSQIRFARQRWRKHRFNYIKRHFNSDLKLLWMFTLLLCNKQRFGYSKLLIFWSTNFWISEIRSFPPLLIEKKNLFFMLLQLSHWTNIDVVLHFWHFQVFESSLSWDLLWIVGSFARSLENPPFFYSPDPPGLSPGPGLQQHTFLKRVLQMGTAQCFLVASETVQRQTVGRL